MKKIGPFILLIIIVFALGFGLCFTLEGLFQKPFIGVPSDQLPTQQYVDAATYRHFFSEDIVIHGKDSKGTPFFLKLSLNRKEEGKEKFIHYYFSKILYGNLNKSGYVDFDSATPDITAQKIFLSYSHQAASGISTRENFDFLINLDNRHIHVTIDDLKGDFLIRNRPEYTKYGSAGNAKIEVEGESFTAHAFVSTIYSSDYSNYLFFDGYDSVHPLTNYLIFWDQEGSFYLIDHTITEKENPSYPPHTWVLYKDGAENWMKKAFDVDIEVKETAGLPKSWHVTIPDFHAEINLQADTFFEHSSREGVGSGTVTKPNGTFAIGGFFERYQ